jgi:hypothetical protein
MNKNSSLNRAAYYEDTCTLENTDRGRTFVAEVVNFNYQKNIACVIEGGVEIRLQYDSKHKQYVGSMAGFEFITKGPKGINY